MTRLQAEGAGQEGRMGVGPQRPRPDEQGHDRADDHVGLHSRAHATLLGPVQVEPTGRQIAGDQRDRPVPKRQSRLDDACGDDAVAGAAVPGMGPVAVER